MRRIFALLFPCVWRYQAPRSNRLRLTRPSADFAKYAMKLREQALLKVEPQVFVPTTSRPADPAFPMENQHRDHGLLDWRAGRRQQPGAELQKLAGMRIGQAITADLITPISVAAQLYPGRLYSAAKSILLRAALQRRDARPIQARSAAGHSVV